MPASALGRGGSPGQRWSQRGQGCGLGQGCGGTRANERGLWPVAHCNWCFPLAVSEGEREVQGEGDEISLAPL